MNATKERLVKCLCFWCGNPIEFDAQLLPETDFISDPVTVLFRKTTSRILEWKCPHCHKTTWLYDPENRTGRTSARWKYEGKVPNLGNCPDCKKPVSPNAMSCPHCGRQMKSSAGNVLAGIIIFLLILLGLWWFLNFMATNAPH